MIRQVAAALIGSGLLATSAAASTFEAETFSTARPHRVVLDRDARGGRALVLRSDEVARRVASSPASRRIVVQAARTDRCRGGSTLMVRAGGVEVALHLADRSPRQFSWPARLAAGRRRLALSLPRLGPCTHRVRVDYVSLPSGRRIPLGAAVGWRPVAGDAGAQRTIGREFDSLTTENDLKMAIVHPQQDRYDFSGGDALVAFARARGMEIRGHTLVWGRQLPRWLTDPLLPWSREQLLGILRDHIQAVVGRYRGQIPDWDVVNEAIAADGDYTRNFWFDQLGPEYIELAFRWAHEADPAARLYYNDVAIENGGPQADAVASLVAGLRRRGVPVHGVGIQRHTFAGDSTKTAELERALRRFAGLVPSVRITEMDVSLPAGDHSAAALRRQATVYRRTARACRRVGACAGLTVWGLSDPLSWLGAEARPLLFDDRYLGKPAYYAVREALPGRP